MSDLEDKTVEDKTLENKPSENSSLKSDSSQQQTKQSPGIFSIIQSVLAAMVGIQSKDKHEQDFEGGHIGSYIFVGVVMVIIFIFTLITIVNNILESSGQ